MPEIKHVFNQGKINKDLDERLVPNGQYRDALNIQVSTSEGSDVGAIENILGNKLLEFNLPLNSTCVGSVADEKNNSLYWFITSEYIDMILEYKEDVITPVIVDTKANTPEAVLKFPDKIITGINIIDNLLFWTDNKTEPKKINIDLCKEGTLQNGYTHTFLIVPDRNITFSSAVKIREEHITVIKKSPKKQLTLNILKEKLTTANADIVFADNNGDIYSPGDLFIVENINITRGSSFVEGEDILLLNSTSVLELPDNFEIRVEVYRNLSGLQQIGQGNTTFTYPANSYEFKVLSVGALVTNTLTNFNFYQGENNEKFFDKKFVRFSYRYKYRDGEYSCFAPFSQIAFIPDAFDYQTKFAYNQGMQNYMSTLEVSGFKQTDMLESVVQIDILYKESNSPIVYIVDKIKPTDVQTTDFVNNLGNIVVANYWEADVYKIKSDLIHNALPSNQLLRPFDNLPRYALAQDVSGSRIVYGNYVQNYDILNDQDKPQKPVLKSWYQNRFDDVIFSNQQGLKSLKSVREYQLGIVYIDDYGRETPVFSNALSTFKVPKKESRNYNKIITKIETSHPDWAKGFKFYIKETANEYYNLAMDRVYRAEDGNLWLSFPSSERNKVDEETFLILKKPVDSNDIVEEEAKYKIIAIDDEAPDFIKTEKTLLTSTQGDLSGTSTPPISYIFTNDNSPQINSSSFEININNWTTPISGVTLPRLDEIKDKISITFKDAVQNIYSEEYKVADISTDDSANPILYIVTLERPIEERDSWIYPNLVDGDPATTSTTNVDLSSVLEIIIHTFTLQDTLEFEGRFFVKINSDEIAEKYIVQASIGEVNYETLSFANLFYLSDTSVVTGNGTTHAISGSYTGVDGANLPLLNYNSSTADYDIIYNPFINVNPTSVPGFPSSVATDEWVDVIDGDDKWFIDQAYFRGIAPLVHEEDTTETHYQNNYTNKLSWGISIRTFYSSSDYYQEFDVWEPNAVLDSVTKANNDPNFKQGIYQDNTGQWYVDISFSHLGDGVDIGINVAFTGGAYQSGNTKSDELWSLPSSQQKFVQNLKAGSVFHFSNDDNKTKYRINGQPKVERRFNHTNYLDYRYRFADESINYQMTNITSLGLVQFASASNRRITYKIPFEFLDQSLNETADIFDQGAGSNFSGNNILETANLTNSVSLNFLKERYDENIRLASENPAIWETVPKESIDLDIYYEASQVYPISFSGKSCGVLVSKNAKVSCDIGNTVPTNTVVLYVNENIIKVSNFVNDSTVDQDDIFTFTDQDGGYVKLKYDGLVNPTTDNFGNSISQFVRFKSEIYNEVGLAWHNCYSFSNGVESNRLRDDYNEVIIDKGAKASSTIEDVYKEENRSSGLIYSGLYNSTSGVNNLNQFIQAENITKDLNPTYGSIQKLFSRNTDIIALCEDRVIKILANKDAVFNADGNANLTATNKVLGQSMPFAGDYGISKNPESFAKENFRAYFTDKQRGAVIRLSMDGLTPISEYGLSNYFSENLKLNDVLLGSFDGDKNEYNLTLYQNKTTISFDEKVKGWSSFKSFVPEEAISMANDYYTFKSGQLYKHHQKDVDRNTFYGEKYLSTVNVILNDQPGVIKHFKTLNYEGSQSYVVKESSDVRTGYYNLALKDGWYVDSIVTDEEKGFVDEFIEKEGKWFNFIKGRDVAQTLDIKTNEFSFQGLGKFSEISINGDIYVENPPTPIPGCTDATALNYNPLANTDDGSCTYAPPVPGCMNPNATNYNPLATVDDGSCNIPIYGCTDPTALNYNSQATVNDGSCDYIIAPDPGSIVYGCTDPNASNYNPLATADDGSCVWVVPMPGCTDPTALNYDPNANIDDGSCTYTPTQINHTVQLNFQITSAPSGGSNGPYTDGSTYTHSNGTTYTTVDFSSYGLPYVNLNGDPFTINGNLLLQGSSLLQTITLQNQYQTGQQVQEVVEITLYPAATPNGRVIFDFPFVTGPGGNISQTTGYLQRMYYGWGDAKNNLTAASLRVQQTDQPYNWINPDYTGVNMSGSPEYSEWHNQADPTGAQPTKEVSFTGVSSIISSITALEIYNSGTNVNAELYFPREIKLTVTLDFMMPYLGQNSSTYPVDINLYHNTENQGDLNWVDPNSSPVYGCTDPSAFNYNPLATVNDGSCIPIVSGCTDPNAINYYPGANTDDGSCIYSI